MRLVLNNISLTWWDSCNYILDLERGKSDQSVILVMTNNICRLITYIARVATLLTYHCKMVTITSLHFIITSPVNSLACIWNTHNCLDVGYLNTENFMVTKHIQVWLCAWKMIGHVRRTFWTRTSYWNDVLPYSWRFTRLPSACTIYFYLQLSTYHRTHL